MDLLIGAIGEEEVLLLRIFREGDVPRRAVAERVLLDEGFLHELSLFREDLDAIVGPIADVDEAIARQLRAVYGVPKLLRRRTIRFVPPERFVVRLVAVRAPVPL